MPRLSLALLISAAAVGGVGATPYGLTGAAEQTPAEAALPVPEQVADGRVFERDGIWYIRAVPGDTPDTLARDAYGNPELWFLLVHANRDRLASRAPGDDSPLDLVIPAPPRQRVMQLGDSYVLRAIPGDTFQGIAADIYGTPDAWEHVYRANRAKLPDPEDPTQIFPEEGGERFVLMVLPAPPEGGFPGRRPGEVVAGGETPGTSPDRRGTPGGSGSPPLRTGDVGSYAGVPATGYTGGGSSTRSTYGALNPRTGPATIDWSRTAGGTGDPLVMGEAPGPRYRPGARTGTGTAPTGPLPRPSSSEASAAPLPGGLAALNIRGPRDIGPREAATILEAAGFTHSRIVNKHTPPARNAQEAALMALAWGNTYSRPRQTVALDDRSRQWVFEAYTQLREAQEKYQGWPEISRRSNPQAYERWVVEASQHLTNVPANQRVALMRSLMQTETGQTHWSGYRPVVSHAGAVGFGQFLPATARNLGINPYDPQQNIEGIARYVNQLIGQSRGSRQPVREALARYNGGNSPPSSSYRYADGILGRLA